MVDNNVPKGEEGTPEEYKAVDNSITRGQLSDTLSDDALEESIVGPQNDQEVENALVGNEADTLSDDALEESIIDSNDNAESYEKLGDDIVDDEYGAVEKDILDDAA